MHRRPPGEASSLGVVEEFFGVALNDEVIQKVRRLPAAQLEELRSRLFDNETAYRALFLDRVRRGDEPTGSRAEIMHIHEDSLASGLGYARTTDIANAPALKHLALYCDRTVLEDPLTPSPLWLPLDAAISGDWRPAHHRQWRHDLADGLRQLKDLGDLVRTGCLVLVPPIRAHFERAPFSAQNIIHGLLDPFSDWIVHQQRPQVLAAFRELVLARRSLLSEDGLLPPEHRAEFRHSVEQWRNLYAEMLATLARHYPFPVAIDELEHITDAAVMAHEFSLTPVTSNPHLAKHWEQYSRIVLGGHPSHAVPSIGPAVRYTVPSLVNVRLDEVIRLRRNEEVFAELRSALQTLAEVCSAGAAPDGYQAYTTQVRNNAEDIVRPAFERLRKWRRRARLTKWGGKALVTAATFGIGAVADTLASIAGDLAGGRAEGLITPKSERMIRDADLALGILKTIMPEKSPIRGKRSRPGVPIGGRR
jgi:hypothetical protein